MLGLGEKYMVLDFYLPGKHDAEGSKKEQKSHLVTILHQRLTATGCGLSSREPQSKRGLACWSMNKTC